MRWVIMTLLLWSQLACDPAFAEDTPAPRKIVLATFFAEFLSGLRSIAPDFEMETGIALEVQGIPYLSSPMWLQTRFLGGNPPEALLLETTALAHRYGQAGLLVRFDDAITKPNPLSGGDRPWRDDFRHPHIQQSLDVNGHLYLIPYTQYGVGFFYKKDVYEKAGLTPPANWDEFMSNLARVKEMGLTPFTTAIKPDDARSVWIASTLLECFMRIHIPEMNIVPSRPDWRFDMADRSCTIEERLDLAELVIAFERGIIDPVKAPEFAETCRIIKDMSCYWREDFISLSGVEVDKIFASGRSVHDMNGTWYLGELKYLIPIMTAVAPELKFEYGAFPFPAITTATSTLARAGGINQNAGMRACLLVPSMPGREAQTAAGVLLCHYLTLPRVAKKVFGNANVFDIPAMDGVDPKPEALPLLPKMEFAYLPGASFSGYDGQSTSEFWPLWQMYLGEQTSLDGFLQALSQSHRKSLLRLRDINRNEYDASLVRRELGRDFE